MSSANYDIYSILTTGPEAPWNIVWKNAEIIEATFSFSGDWLKLERKHIIDNMAGNNLPREEVEGFLLKLILESSQMEHIQKLSLYINDYYRNMNYAVDLIASRKRPRLEWLFIGYRNYNENWSLDELDYPEFPDPPLVSPKSTKLLCLKTPMLESLTVEGENVFSELEHDHLAYLDVHGWCPIHQCGLDLGSGKGINLPNLKEIVIRNTNPSGGHGPPLDAAFLYFCPKRLPKLKKIDISEAELWSGEEDDRGSFLVLAESAILPQLENLVLDIVDFGIEEINYEDILRDVAPKFFHLKNLHIRNEQKDHVDLVKRIKELVQSKGKNT